MAMSTCSSRAMFMWTSTNFLNLVATSAIAVTRVSWCSVGRGEWRARPTSFSITAIMEKEVGLALHSPRPTLHQETLVTAIALVATRFRKFVDVHMNIARDEQVDIAISIVIGPCRTCCKPVYLQSSAVGHIFEFAVAQVVIERSPSVPSHKKIQASVIIEVCNRYAHAPALTGQACLLRDVGEVHIRILMIERDQWVAALPEP